MNDFNISSSKNLNLYSQNITFGYTTTNLSFPCNIFPTNTSYAGFVNNVSNFSNSTNVSGINNISSILTKSFNVSEQPNSLFGKNLVLSEDGTTFAVGSPQYDSNFTNAGRVDIYRNSSLLNTFVGDVNNAAFGTNLAINGSTVLMGSPNYLNNRGIFHQYTDGILSQSIVGPDPSIRYGKYLLIDQSGNKIMYTDSITNDVDSYTYYKFSDNVSVAANVYKTSYNNVLSNSYFNSSFKFINFNNVITNGNASSYVINTLKVNSVRTNVSLVLANSSFEAVANGWDLSNVFYNDFYTTANNSTYFAVILFSYPNLTVYIGNFLNTNRVHYGSYVFPYGSIVATMNKQNILSITGGSKTKLFSISDTSTVELADIDATNITSLAANASVVAVTTNSSLQVYDISSPHVKRLDVAGTYSNVAINASGTTLVATSSKGVDIFNKNSSIATILGLPNINYGQNIAIADDVVATSTPYYNSSSGLVQVFNDIYSLGNISANTSTNFSSTTKLYDKTNVIHANRVNVMNTSFLVTTITNVSNVSSYEYNASEQQMSFVGFKTISYDTSAESNVVLNIGADPLIEYVNIGNPTNVSVLNSSTLTTDHLYGNYGNITTIDSVSLTSYYGNVSVLSTNNISNSDSFSSTNGNITTLTTANISNSDSFSSTNGNITTLTTANISNSDSFSSTNGNITTLTTANISNSGNFSTTNGNITTLTTANISNSGTFSSTSGNITTLATAIISNSGSFSTTNGSITTLTTANISNSDSFSSTNGNITTLTTANISNSDSFLSLIHI